MLTDSDRNPAKEDPSVSPRMPPFCRVLAGWTWGAPQKEKPPLRPNQPSCPGGVRGCPSKLDIQADLGFLFC